MKRMVLKRFSKRTLFALWIFFVALVAVVATYVYMLNKPASLDLRRDVSNGLVLEIDKTVYKRGESVTITFTNYSTKTVTFRDYAWAKIRDSEGRVVAPGLRAEAELDVPAGGSLTWVWDQQDPFPYGLVPPGIYTVSTTGRLVQPLADLSVEFEIMSR